MSCGTPKPVTMRVMQIEPGPTPTLMASAPASIRSRVPSAVATLPAMISTSPKRRRRARTVSMPLSEWPWAMSTTSTSAPASIQHGRPLEKSRSHADCRAHPQPALAVFGRPRVLRAGARCPWS